MTNTLLLKKEFFRTHRPALIILYTSGIVFSVAFLLFNYLSLPGAALLRKTAFLIPFCGAFYFVKVITGSYLYRTAFIRGFEREEIYSASLSLVFPLSILLVTSLLVLNVSGLWQGGAGVAVSGFAAESLVGVIDLVLFFVIIYACSLFQNDMASFFVPLLPFIAVLIPKYIIDFVRIGYGSYRMNTEISSFYSAFQSFGGIVFIIENAAFILGLVIITRKYFCSKDF